MEGASRAGKGEGHLDRSRQAEARQVSHQHNKTRRDYDEYGVLLTEFVWKPKCPESLSVSTVKVFAWHPKKEDLEVEREEEEVKERPL